MSVSQKRKRRRKKTVKMSVRSYLCSLMWALSGTNLWNRPPSWLEPTRGCCSAQEAWITENLKHPPTHTYMHLQAHTPHDNPPSFVHLNQHMHLKHMNAAAYIFTQHFRSSYVHFHYCRCLNCT